MSELNLVVVTFVYAELESQTFLAQRPFVVADMQDLTCKIAAFRAEIERDRTYVVNMIMTSITDVDGYHVELV